MIFDHDPRFCTSDPELLHAPRAEIFYLSLEPVFLGKGSAAAHESAEPPD